MKKTIFLLLLINPILSFAFPHTDATLTPGSQGTLNDNKIYAGINWQIGVKASFDAIFGFRTAHTSSSGNITGADLNIGIPINKEHFRDAKLKAEYLNGNTTGQANVGVGYIFGRDKFLGTIGYNLPYLKIGTDYVFKDGFEPYLQINTLDKYKKPSSSPSTYSCPNPFYPIYYASINGLTNVCATPP